MKIIWKVTKRDAIAIFTLFLILLFVFSVRTHKEDFLFYHESPEQGYTWNGSTPEYVCESDYTGMKCNWLNVPIGFENVTGRYKCPKTYFIYENQTNLSIALLLIAFGLMIKNRKNIIKMFKKLKRDLPDKL